MSVKAGQIEQDMRPVSIYALADGDGVRYVGKTVMPLPRRFAVHCSRALRHPTDYVSHWIASLLAEGQKPTMQLLEVVDASEWETAERYWIRQLRLMGCRLANHADGGGGGTMGWKAPAETRARMSASAKKRATNPGERERLRSITNGTPPIGKGEANGFARFTTADVIAMRERVAAGESQSVVAAEYGTSRAQVHWVVTGKTWATSVAPSGRSAQPM